MARGNRRQPDGWLLRLILTFSVLVPISLAIVGSLAGAIVVTAARLPKVEPRGALTVTAKLKNRDSDETWADVAVSFTDVDADAAH